MHRYRHHRCRTQHPLKSGFHHSRHLLFAGLPRLRQAYRNRRSTVCQCRRFR
jgi:hypothetical protein